MNVYGQHPKQLQSNAKALFVLKALKRALENKGYPQPLNKFKLRTLWAKVFEDS